MPGLPKLNIEKARAIRVMALAGFTQVQLAVIFRVSKSLIGQVILEQCWKDGGCKGCRGPLPPGRASRLCDTCRPQVCAHCGGPKPVQRRSIRCVVCDRERWAQYRDTRPHVCRTCGESLPEERRDTLCSECRRDEGQFYAERQAERNRGRLCAKEGCEQPLPQQRSWTYRLCRECKNRHDQLRRSLSRRVCGICERRLNEHERGLCHTCAADDRRIREITRRERERTA